MNLPDSIQKITEEKLGDMFLTPSIVAQPDMDQLIFSIKNLLGPKEVKSFEQGRAFYKVSNSEKTFVRNLLHLYVETVVAKIKEAEIDIEVKRSLIANFENTCNALISIFDVQREMLKNFNNQKNIIDVTEISCIMAGYAIETIKKIYNAKA